MGNNMKAALEFAQRHPGWHGYAVRDRATRQAIAALALRGLVEVNEFDQFRLMVED